MSPFPFPDEETIDRQHDRIHELKDDLWEAMKGTFTQSREGRGDFHMGQLRPLIDQVDEVVAKLYDLDENELEYTQTYLTHLGANSGRAGTGDSDIRDYVETAATDD